LPGETESPWHRMQHHLPALTLSSSSLGLQFPLSCMTQTLAHLKKQDQNTVQSYGLLHYIYEHPQGSSTLQAKQGSTEKNSTLIKTTFSCSLGSKPPPQVTLKVVCWKHKDSNNGTADARELVPPSPGSPTDAHSLFIEG